MKQHVVSAVLSLIFLTAPLYAGDDNQCDKCRNDSQKELLKCLEGAISQEDKKSCTEKNDERVKGCEKLECKISTGK